MSGDCRVLAEQVLEHGSLGPRRMRTLRDLGELQRIAEEDDVAGRRPHGERIRERHLARFVDHERVDERAARPIAVEVPVGEQPRRSREEQDVAAGAHERSHLRLDAARDEPPGVE